MPVTSLDPRTALIVVDAMTDNYLDDRRGAPLMRDIPIKPPLRAKLGARRIPGIFKYRYLFPNQENRHTLFFQLPKRNRPNEIEITEIVRPSKFVFTARDANGSLAEGR